MKVKTKKNIWDVFISHLEFLSNRKILKGRMVDFNATHEVFRGVIKDISGKGGGIICITIASPEFCKRFTDNPWESWHDKYLEVLLCERGLIREIRNGGKIYIAFMNVNNMIIHMKE